VIHQSAYGAEPVVPARGRAEPRRLPYAEAGYAYPESGQVVINVTHVTNGKVIRPAGRRRTLRFRYGELSSHERLLGLPDRGVAPSAATSDPATVPVNALCSRGALLSVVPMSPP